MLSEAFRTRADGVAANRRACRCGRVPGQDEGGGGPNDLQEARECGISELLDQREVGHAEVPVARNGAGHDGSDLGGAELRRDAMGASELEAEAGGQAGSGDCDGIAAPETPAGRPHKHHFFNRSWVWLTLRLYLGGSASRRQK